MTEFSGTLTVNGNPVKWSRNPGLGGIVVEFEGGQTVRLPGEPDQERIELALIAWQQGYSDGQHTGRSVLQNEFRNLMACQPR